MTAEAMKSTRFAAMLLFQFRVVKNGTFNKRRLCERRIVVISASDASAALKAAKKQGKQAEHKYLNSDGDTVRFEFVGVLDLIHLGDECESNEVWYEYREMSEPMERRNKLIPTANRLKGIATT